MSAYARAPTQSPSPVLIPQSDSSDPLSRIESERIPSPASVVSRDWESSRAASVKHARWRHTLGIILLLVTVVLWTASNFLASTIFADDTYSKPYFVTYVNTSFFILPVLPMMLRLAWRERGRQSTFKGLLNRKVGNYALITQNEEEDDYIKTGEGRGNRASGAAQMLLAEELEDEAGRSARSGSGSGSSRSLGSKDVLTVWDTMRLSIEFCIPWFLANYFTAACLEYTTVASSTILASTSSIWTLLIGSLVGVETFTLRKLLGVLASLFGIILISLVDISGSNDENRGDFPHKSKHEIIIGDSMAFLSALLYGGYTILMKKRIGDESKVNMVLFFAFIGFFNVVALWPGFVFLHFFKVETFELPPTKWVTWIVLINSLSSLVADITWAFAMLLTSPLVVTVGLSLTIPLSLIGQMVIDNQYSAPLYWIGAFVVFLSFIFINREESKNEEESSMTEG